MAHLRCNEALLVSRGVVDMSEISPFFSRSCLSFMSHGVIRDIHMMLYGEDLQQSTQKHQQSIIV